MTKDERKQAYRDAQRAREAARRYALGLAPYTFPGPAPKRAVRTPKPVHGSQQWAETYRDDLGESFD